MLSYSIVVSYTPFLGSFRVGKLPQQICAVLKSAATGTSSVSNNVLLFFWHLHDNFD